ncbi:hypothetical protein ANN_01114 [Periplaneta americana]|uniref:Reverse transcriptase domain-containing protein n=1 Tax=Periplaneta americana TaxID=6978 RepID=A0ABQ8TSQ2_PERAM|nr:hypothetical protein ANN_01114 [Periplaneta americana]
MNCQECPLNVSFDGNDLRKEKRSVGRKGKCIRDAIGLLRTIGERYLEKNKDLYIVFVDLEKAFDKVYPDKLMDILEKISVDWKKEETILRDILLELNDSCEQYGMKINANKTKTMVYRKKNKEGNDDMENFTLNGVQIVLSQCKNNKAPGEDGINLELFNEGWTIRNIDSQRLTAAEMKFMRRTAGYTRMDHIKNFDIMKELQIEPITEYLQKYRQN